MKRPVVLSADAWVALTGVVGSERVDLCPRVPCHIEVDDDNMLVVTPRGIYLEAQRAANAPEVWFYSDPEGFDDLARVLPPGAGAVQSGQAVRLGHPLN